MIRYQSSFRALPLEESLARARKAAQLFGISRVTNITRLDRVGIPVFASVRPGAVEGSLCVNAGKSFSISEAKVGAYMEAVEFAAAEVGTSGIRTRLARVRDVLAVDGRIDGILDLCPQVGMKLPLDAKLPCCIATDLESARHLVPAELVFFPYPLPREVTYFGSTTNGLASGATLPEATLHGLLELVERDTASFQWLGRGSRRVRVSSLPEPHKSLVGNISSHGFEMIIRWLPNDFGIPCFHAVLWERGRLDPIYINDGYGCHLDPTIALTRALTEAAQSRLTFIHGARDDIKRRYVEFKDTTSRRKRNYARRLIARELNGAASFDFRTVANAAAGATTIDELLRRVRHRLRQSGIPRVLRVRLTPPHCEMEIVRVIVPLLEFFSPSTNRLGPRLARFANDG